MAISAGAGLSEHPDPRAAGGNAASLALGDLGGTPVSLAIVFSSGAHLDAAEAVLEGVHEALAPEMLIGCGAGGVLAQDSEVEDGTAVAVWAASLTGESSAQAFHAEALESDPSVITGFPGLDGASGLLLIPDPYSFAPEGLLAAVAAEAPGVPIVGGLASGRGPDGGALLFHGQEVLGHGAVGVRLDGVEMLPCVSQGAAPLGPELTVTAAEGQVIHELAGRPALAKLQEVVEQIGVVDRMRLATGLLLGIVVNGNQPEYGHGDFLVRGIIGADPDRGSIAVGTEVFPGQVVRLHARDADSADRDLRSGLELRREALGGRRPAGALMFTCNGRGAAMFGAPHHDAAVLAEELGGPPVAGFFAAGEIGPIGGEPFVHGFTATVAVFAP